MFWLIAQGWYKYHDHMGLLIFSQLDFFPCGSFTMNSLSNMQMFDFSTFSCMSKDSNLTNVRQYIIVHLHYQKNSKKINISDSFVYLLVSWIFLFCFWKISVQVLEMYCWIIMDFGYQPSAREEVGTYFLPFCMCSFNPIDCFFCG